LFSIVKNLNHLLTTTPEMVQVLKDYVDEDCIHTLADLQMLMQGAFGVDPCLSTIHEAIVGFNYSFKRIQPFAAAAYTPELEAIRVEFSHWLLAEHNNPDSNIIYADEEVGFTIASRRTYGRSPVEQRAQTRTPVIRSRNVTVMAALHKNSLIHFEVLPTAGNTEHFLSFVNHLAEKCDENGLGNCVIVMDNVRFHRGVNVTNRITELNMRYKFLPAYTPYFNAIECLFAQWKKIVRRAEPMNHVELVAAINNFQNIIEAEE
jgi:hypothetical protein